ncbi:MAG: DOMON-like domain-containing protein [Blastomonas sp.]|nr:DOMON-like domain-containing protein [Blastomonas sp.]
MESRKLIPHPDCPPPHDVVLATAWMLDANRLTIEYAFADPTDAVLWPAPAPGRTDNLWQHSCLEAFVASTTGPGYAEFNLVPSGAWAAYAFDDYRAGMRDLDIATPPLIHHDMAARWHVTLDLTGLAALIGPAPWRLAITAVIEAKDGAKSYWSLAHPPGKPDFHHADCFAARLG